MRKSSRTRWVIHKQGPLLGLIALMVGIYLCQEFVTSDWDLRFMAVPGMIVDSWHNLMAGAADGADYREFGTLLSCAFLHGSIDHVLYNMLYLWIFAALAVDLLGTRWMLLIFTVTAVSGSVCHTLLHAGSFSPMLGASGAVMGFEGAYLGLATRWHLPDPHVWPMTRAIPPGHLAILAIFGVAMDYLALTGNTCGGIAYGAHLGGFVAGLFLTSVAAPKPRAAAVR